MHDAVARLKVRYDYLCVINKNIIAIDGYFNVFTQQRRCGLAIDQISGKDFCTEHVIK